MLILCSPGKNECSDVQDGHDGGRYGNQLLSSPHVRAFYRERTDAHGAFHKWVSAFLDFF
jgi:hypothetical protein